MSGTAIPATKTTARLVVTHGPDRGMLLKLGEELTHVGRAADNTIVLSDPGVADHHLSIVFRNGRYAVYTPLERAVDVDGNVIPHARWVWLPESARLRLSEKTALQFSLGDAERPASERPAGSERPAKPARPAAAAPALPASASVNGDGDSVVVARRPDGAPVKRKRKEQAVARFITDRPGDALVTLGDDGHLPELNLVEGSERAAAHTEKKEANPLVLYGVLALSLLVSMVLLLVDSGVGGGASADKVQARSDIRKFYGVDGGELQPWQKQLRQARLAASRGDRAAERRAYRRVLDQLNAEDLNRFTGLTGTPQQDDELRRFIGILMQE